MNRGSAEKRFFCCLPQRCYCVWQNDDVGKFLSLGKYSWKWLSSSSECSTQKLEAQDTKVLHQILFFSSCNKGSSIVHPNPDKQCWMWTKRQKHKPPIDGGNMCLKFADRKISFPLNHPHPPPPSPTAPTNPKWLTRQDKGQEIYSNGMPENPF